jgi:uncharacterized membrane protein
VQLTQLPLSSLQEKPEPVSLEEKEKLAEVAVVVPLGPLAIVVGGGVVSGGGPDASTVQTWAIAVGSTFPALSIARTPKTWEPATTPE